jgi:hypothetical protein
MGNIVEAPGSRFPPTRPPEQTDTDCSSSSTADEQHGCDVCNLRSKSYCCDEQTDGKCSNSGLPEMTARCPAPASTDFPGQDAARQNEPPRAGIGWLDDGTEQETGDGGGHEEGNGTSELVEPGTAHIPSE